MKTVVISVTDAARNFADCVNRAHYQDVTFVLVKSGEPVARLVPAHEKKGTGRALAEALSSVHLSKDEREAWRKDIVVARRRIKAPVDKWR